MIVDLQMRVHIIQHLRAWKIVSEYKSVNYQNKETAKWRGYQA